MDDRSDVMIGMINAHETLDKVRFAAIGDRLEKIEATLDKCAWGIIATVGLAVLQMVIKFAH